MTATSAIALTRVLWPAVTDTAAPDAFLTAWYDDAAARAGDAYFGTSREMAVAHLLAHAAYRVLPSLNGGNVASPGAVSAATSSRRSVTYGGKSASDHAMTMADAELATTRPGQAYIALRDRQLDRLPEVVMPW